VALGDLANRVGVSSQANLLIFMKVLVSNIATTSHHGREVPPNYLIERKINNKKRIKHMNGFGNICILDR
jgi:hypothetical protein